VRCDPTSFTDERSATTSVAATYVSLLPLASGGEPVVGLPPVGRCRPEALAVDSADALRPVVGSVHEAARAVRCPVVPRLPAMCPGCTFTGVIAGYGDGARYPSATSLPPKRGTEARRPGLHSRVVEFAEPITRRGSHAPCPLPRHFGRSVQFPIGHTPPISAQTLTKRAVSTLIRDGARGPRCTTKPRRDAGSEGKRSDALQAAA